MARQAFGGTVWDWVLTRARLSPQGRAFATVKPARVVFYTDETGGEKILDLTDAAGNPITDVDTDSNGFVPTFYGPDGVDAMWADGGASGARRMIVSRDRRGAQGEPGAPGGSDEAFAGWVADGESETRAALSATYGLADELMLPAARAGVTVDGTGNQATALAAFVAAANAGGVPGLMSGNARTTDTVTINESVRVKGLPGAKITIDHGANGIDITPAGVAGGAVNAASAGATTVTVAGAGWTTNQHAGKWVTLATSPSETARRVLSNTADTLTLEHPLGANVPASTAATFRVPLDEVVIEDLTVDATSAHNSANIIVRYARSVVLTRVRSLNAGSYGGVTGNAMSIYHSDRVRVVDCESSDSGNFGIFVYNCDDVRVLRPSVTRWGGQFGVQLKDCRDGKIVGGHVVADGTVGDHAYNIKCSGLNPAYGLAVVDSFGSLSQGSDFEMSSIMEEGTWFAANDFAFTGCYSYKSDGSGFATVTDAAAKTVGIKGWVWESCTAVEATRLGFELPLPGMKIVNITARRCRFEGLSVDDADVRVSGALFEDNVQAYTSGASRSSEVLLPATAQRAVLVDCEFRRTSAGKAIRAVREIAGANNNALINPRIVESVAGYSQDYLLSGAGSKAVGRREVDTFTGAPTINKAPPIAAAPATANPNTTGATLTALETEVNELKALLRTAGLLAP